MVQVILVGIGAGLAAALLFLSPFGGTALAFPLFALCGLPIAIAGLAWNVVAALIAAGVAALSILAYLSPTAAGVHLLLFGAPIVWLTRLAGLSRLADPGDPSSVEWYPIGRLLAHAAIAVSIGVVAAGVIMGFDPDALAREMAEMLAQWMADTPGALPPPTPAEMLPFARFNVAAMPFTVSAVLLFILVFNMWLAARVADMSGRLARPRERLWTAALPNEVALVFVGALIAALLLPTGIGQAFGAVTGALGAALALIGFAVIHAVTLGTNLRTLILVTTYVVVILFGFPILLLLILGLAEGFLNIRARRFGATPPTV